ncbi:uncharacterized protein [Patagioenas fasciata]|uniref:uncharacterized protein isoform X1 n=1 Tax=Patagioenas fasciata TaxID=372321 RepID=UPI003A99DDF3
MLSLGIEGGRWRERPWKGCGVQGAAVHVQKCVCCKRPWGAKSSCCCEGTGGGGCTRAGTSLSGGFGERSCWELYSVNSSKHHRVGTTSFPGRTSEWWLQPKLRPSSSSGFSRRCQEGERGHSPATVCRATTPAAALLSLPPLQKLLQQLPLGLAGRPKAPFNGDTAEKVTSPVLDSEPSAAIVSCELMSCGRSLASSLRWIPAPDQHRAGGQQPGDGVRGDLPRMHRPHPQELPQALQPAHRRGGVGAGGHHQHADPLRAHPVPQSQPERRGCVITEILVQLLQSLRSVSPSQ